MHDPGEVPETQMHQRLVQEHFDSYEQSAQSVRSSEHILKVAIYERKIECSHNTSDYHPAELSS